MSLDTRRPKMTVPDALDRRKVSWRYGDGHQPALDFSVWGGKATRLLHDDCSSLAISGSFDQRKAACIS